MSKLHIWILSLFLVLSIGIYGERTSTDPVFWSDFYTFIKATPSTLEKYKKNLAIPDSHIKVINYNRKYNTYRINAVHFTALEKVKATIIANPPFSVVDADIFFRKLQTDLTSWMLGYKDRDLVTKVLFRLEKLFPDCARVYTIGKSRRGRPIYALKISDHPKLDEDEPSFLFNGAHHGNEILTIEYSLDLAYYLLFGQDVFSSQGSFYNKTSNAQGTVHYRSSKIQKFIDELEIWIVPVVNPDGLERFWKHDCWSGRKNERGTWSGKHNSSNGVDLNRNYPFYWKSQIQDASSGVPTSAFYRGPRAGSEPETQAMMKLANDERFFASLSYHSYATKILTPYTIPGSLSPQPNPTLLFAEQLVEVMDSHRKDGPYKTQRNLYTVDGTDQDWLFHEFGTIAFIVEGSYHSPRFEPEGRKSIQGMRPAALKTLDLYMESPILIIYTVDPLGNPLGKTQVHLTHFKFFENEKYTTHPKTGRYDFLLEKGGSFTVVAQKKGYHTKKKSISCSWGHCKHQIILTRR